MKRYYMILEKVQLNKILVTVFLLLFITSSGWAQRFDYSSYPKMDFSFEHLRLDLKIDPQQHLLEGKARYDLRANIAGVDTLVLNAAHMDIGEVRLDAEPVDFELVNDSLHVLMGSPTNKDRAYTLEINYTTSPKFGVHFNARSVWSSFLPKSVRHWLPAPDHPRSSFTTDITLSVPEQWYGAAPGKESSAETGRQIRWISREPVPVSSLWFAAGAFEKEETQAGIKTIHLIDGTGLNSERMDSLLTEAYDLLRDTERRVGLEYPFETLNIVVLDDHRWETKSYGAGSAFLFRNGGDLIHQLRRGIYAQWFGVYQREEQWRDAEAMNLYQSAVHFAGSDSAAILNKEDHPDAVKNPYSPFGADRWNEWQRFYPAWSDTVWKQTIEHTLQEVLVAGPGVRRWDDYADHWYGSTGQPWFEPPVPVYRQDESLSDSTTYRVNYSYDEMEGMLSIGFEAQDSVITELVTLPLIQYSNGKPTDTLEVTFTGKSDSTGVALDPSVSNVVLDASGYPRLHLKEKKPVFFLLNILRREEYPVESKWEAARQLGDHTENPDLQLAIMDMLSRIENAEIRAALLSSLGKITAGATGTEQVFLEQLRSDVHKIQLAAIESLARFSGNERVGEALRSFALQADRPESFKSAAEGFLAVADSSGAIQFLRETIEQDTTGHQSVFLIEKMSQRYRNPFIDQELALMAEPDFDYLVRAKAIELLISRGAEQVLTGEKIRELLVDSDPRIRYLIVSRLSDLPYVDPEEMLQDRMLDEYDGRVFYEMQKNFD